MKHLLTAALITALSTTLVVDMATADTKIVGRDAEDIVREGEILHIVAEDFIGTATRDFIIEHNGRLYVCLQTSDYDYVRWQCISEDD